MLDRIHKAPIDSRLIHMLLAMIRLDPNRIHLTRAHSQIDLAAIQSGLDLALVHAHSLHLGLSLPCSIVLNEFLSPLDDLLILLVLVDGTLLNESGHVVIAERVAVQRLHICALLRLVHYVSLLLRVKFLMLSRRIGVELFFVARAGSNVAEVYGPVHVLALCLEWCICVEPRYSFVLIGFHLLSNFRFELRARILLRSVSQILPVDCVEIVFVSWGFVSRVEASFAILIIGKRTQIASCIQWQRRFGFLRLIFIFRIASCGRLADLLAGHETAGWLVCIFPRVVVHVRIMCSVHAVFKKDVVVILLNLGVKHFGPERRPRIRVLDGRYLLTVGCAIHGRRLLVVGRAIEVGS